MSLPAQPTSMPTALSIASSDSGAGAGIQADLLTFASCGVFGTTAIAALTAQNPDGVSACVPLDPSFLKAQIDQVLAFFPVKAIKTGMLFSEPLIREVIQCLKANDIPAVIDPVMVSTSGEPLLEKDAMHAFVKELLPLATLITPNLDEVEVILGQKPEDASDITEAALQMALYFDTAVLVKGGHLECDELVDVMANPEGTTFTLNAQRIQGVDTHGSGCTLSSAIAAYLAKGIGLTQAIYHGHAYLQRTIRQSLAIESRAFLNHLPNG